MTDIDLSEDPEGDYFLTVEGTDDRTEALFDERGLQGGGYTWHGIVTALIQMHAPELLGQLRVLDAEADNMYAYCSDRTVLERVAALIRAAIADQNQLVAAIEHAGEDLE